MKAVLMSIQPKWCELIASGKKTLEVRKTKPKLPVPFKVYIYCTKDKPYLQSRNNMFFYLEDKDTIGGHGPGLYKRLNGTVIGEFVCNKVEYWQHYWKDDVLHIDDMSALSCVDFFDLMKYANGGRLYGFRISNLKIYEYPKELSEFFSVDNEAVKRCKNRERIYNNPDFTNGAMLPGSYLCNDKVDWCVKCKRKPITRPPQSWCYVEELQG